MNVSDDTPSSAGVSITAHFNMNESDDSIQKRWLSEEFTVESPSRRWAKNTGTKKFLFGIPLGGGMVKPPYIEKEKLK